MKPIILLGALMLGTSAAPWAQQPAPEYSVDEIVGSFACEKAAGDRQAADCAPTGPRVRLRSFALAGARKPVRNSTLRRNLLITFANGSTDLTPQARANARIFAQALNTDRLASYRFVIEGHTNAVGSRTYNQDLSRRRATALANVLVREGVRRDRLDVRGFGYDRPVLASDPSSPANRRVEASRLN